MFKLFLFLERHPHLSREEFVRAWVGEHGPLAVRSEALASRVRRYVQNVAVPDPAVPGLDVASFDAVDELWFDSVEDLEAACSHPSYREAVETSAARFADLGRRIAVVARESVQFDRGFGRVKFIGLSKRAPRFTHDEWCRYWVEVHGPLAHGIPEFTRYYGKYVHNYTLPLRLEVFGDPPDFDGIVEEWLERVEDMARCLAEPLYLERVRPDERHFVDFSASRFLLAEEHAVPLP